MAPPAIIAYLEVVAVQSPVINQARASWARAATCRYTGRGPDKKRQTVVCREGLILATLSLLCNYCSCPELTGQQNLNGSGTAALSGCLTDQRDQIGPGSGCTPVQEPRRHDFGPGRFGACGAIAVIQRVRIERPWSGLSSSGRHGPGDLWRQDSCGMASRSVAADAVFQASGADGQTCGQWSNGCALPA